MLQSAECRLRLSVLFYGHQDNPMPSLLACRQKCMLNGLYHAAHYVERRSYSYAGRPADPLTVIAILFDTRHRTNIRET